MWFHAIDTFLERETLAGASWRYNTEANISEIKNEFCEEENGPFRKPRRCTHREWKQAMFPDSFLATAWWLCGLRHCHWLLAVSHHCLGLHCGWGAHVRIKLPVTWGYVVAFGGYSGFLHQLQLASHELAAIWQKKWRKIKIPNATCSGLSHSTGYSDQLDNTAGWDLPRLLQRSVYVHEPPDDDYACQPTVPS